MELKGSGRGVFQYILPLWWSTLS